ncbi:MAG: hypothetical protein KDA94_14075 [Acidimicrobiales bacterium]|nr:hypothetical protein [Acidimicrobiales bacterium]
MRRVLVGALAAILAVVVLADPAAADPPKPTNFRSTVLEVEPALPAGVEVRIVGGDAFLELRVPRGTTAMVPDYGEEADTGARPYLRFDADGTVSRNDRSLAAAANESRYGSSTEPADEDAEPSWTVVATDGTYAWHDHRVHWMSPRTPKTDERGRVDLGGPDGTWEVGLVVDGMATTVRGALELVDAPSPVPWWGLAILTTVAGLALAGVGLRRADGDERWDVGSPGPLVVATTLAMATAAWVSWTVWRSAPPGAGATLIAATIAVVGVAAGALAAFGPRPSRLVAAALAAASALGWSLTRLGVLSHAVLPGTLPPWLDRSATVVALGLGAALAAALAWRPTRFRSSRPA